MKRNPDPIQVQQLEDLCKRVAEAGEEVKREAAQAEADRLERDKRRAELERMAAAIRPDSPEVETIVRARGLLEVWQEWVATRGKREAGVKRKLVDLLRQLSFLIEDLADPHERKFCNPDCWTRNLCEATSVVASVTALEHANIILRNKPTPPPPPPEPVDSSRPWLGFRIFGAKGS